jgi:hypothetical protein
LSRLSHRAGVQWLAVVEGDPVAVDVHWKSAFD